MRYAGLIKNDLAAAPGVCTTLFVQGCPLHCHGCHNRDAWDFNGGAEFTDETIEAIVSALHANGINRTLCVMGGEPLAPQNQNGVLYFLTRVKDLSPDTKVWLWTGYELETIFSSVSNESTFAQIIEYVDTIVDGPYIERLRDVTLPHRGSSNQHIWHKINDKWKMEE